MFTGIVEEMGQVVAARAGSLTIAAAKALEETREGDSIAVDGACLTVVRLDRETFSVDVTPETLRRTNLGSLRPGDAVNLERAAALGQRVGGHLVQGHVEATGQVISLHPEGDSTLMAFGCPAPLLRYVVPKGFIAVDGVSLTVAQCDVSSFVVAVIPYTLRHTVLGLRKPGDGVNLETDVVARYVERLAHGAGAQQAGP